MKQRIFILLFIFMSFDAFSQVHDGTCADLYDGKIDSFTINSNLFRLRWTDSITRLIVLEKKLVDWVIIDTIEWQNQYKFKDINKDGYLDLGFTSKRTSQVYLYNPKTNIFLNSGDYSYLEFYSKIDFGNGNMVLLDKNKHIYCDYQPYKKQEWTSYLFQIKNYKRVDLASIYQETEYSELKNDLIDLDIIVSKYDDNGNEKVVKRIKRIGENQYKYANYWKLNWKKFIRD